MCSVMLWPFFIVFVETAEEIFCKKERLFLFVTFKDYKDIERDYILKN